jgi:hypothetical protein
MAQYKSFDISPGDGGIRVDVEGQKFRFQRDRDELLIEAFDEDAPIEALRSSLGMSERRVYVRDAHRSAVYIGSNDGESISFIIEADGRSFRVSGRASQIADALTKALEGVELPKLERILALTSEVQHNGEFRDSVQEHLGDVAFRSLSSDCTQACQMAGRFFPASPGLGIFAAGYCAACVLHS